MVSVEYVESQEEGSIHLNIDLITKWNHTGRRRNLLGTKTTQSKRRKIENEVGLLTEFKKIVERKVLELKKVL